MDGASVGEGSVAVPDGPWLACPWCGGAVPLSHLVDADEEVGAVVAVCPGCGRRVTVHPPSGS